MEKNELNQNSAIGVVVNKLTTDHKDIAAILSKLQEDASDTDNSTMTKNKDLNKVDYPTLKTHSEKNNEKTKTNDDILRIFPDALIAQEILVGCIVAPNSFKQINLNYTGPMDFPILDTVKKGVMSIVKEHIEKYYKLEDKLRDIVREALFSKGSYIECFIPEASLDDAINAGTESIKKFGKDVNIFLSEDKSNDYGNIIQSLSPGLNSNNIVDVNVSYKDKFSNLGVNKDYNFTTKGLVLDNNLTIPLPKITENIKSLRNITQDIKKIKEGLRAGNLSSNILFDKSGNITRTKEEDEMLDFLRVFTKKAENRRSIMSDEDDNVLRINSRIDASRKSIGRPLVLKVKSESVIPVHSPYDKKDHVGYFILLDETGKLLDLEADDDAYLQDPDSGAPVNIGTIDHNAFITQARRNTEAMTSEADSLSVNEELFTSIVHEMLDSRLKKGAFGDLALLNKQDNQLIYKMMFFRALKNKATQMLFLPSELVAYYAYEYRKDGTGRSLLEKTSFLYSLRAMLLMATVNASLTNAVNTQEVTIDLDEKILNVEEVVSQVQEALISNREMTFPIGTINPITLQSLLARSGYKLNVNSPNLPQINISTSDSSRSVTVPDESLDEKLKDMQLLSMGITPEMVKQGNEVDFATIATSRQLLFDTRVSLLRQQTDNLNTEYVRKVFKADEDLREKVEKYIISNFKILSAFLAKNINDKQETNNSMSISDDAFILYTNKAMEAFEEGLEVKLPKSELEDGGPVIKNMQSVFSNIDTTIDTMFTSDLLSSDFLGETLGNKSQLIITMLKTALKRKWIVENNALPDLIEIIKPITDASDDADNMFNGFISDLESVIEQFASAYNLRKKLGKQSDVIKKIDEEGNDEYKSWGDSASGGSWEDSGSDDSGSDDSGGDEGGDEGGGDEGGGGDDDFDFGSDDDTGDDGDDGGEGEDDDQSLDDDMSDDDDGGGDDDNPTKGTEDEISGWV